MTVSVCPDVSDNRPDRVHVETKRMATAARARATLVRIRERCRGRKVRPASLRESRTAKEVVEAAQDVIYDHPLAYDVAFSYRDVQEEVDFLESVMDEHARPSACSSVVEIGCGPARHCLELARRGKHCYGIDNNPKMVEYGEKKARAEGLGHMNLVQADMRNFELHLQADLVCCLLGTLSHLHTEEDLAQTFQACARNNRPGGLLVLEISHPAELFDGSLMDPHGDAWEAEEEGVRVVVEWGREGDFFSPITQIIERTVGLTVLNDRGGLMYSLEQVVPQRQFTLAELKGFARLAGYDYVIAYGEMEPSLEVSPEADDACRLVVILRKK